MLALIVRLMHMLHDRLDRHATKLATKAEATAKRYDAALTARNEARKFLAGVKTLLGR